MKMLWLLPLIAMTAPDSSTGMHSIVEHLATDSSGLVSKHCILTVQSAPESAHVMLDGRFIGFTPITIDSIKPGVHLLTIQHPDVENWFAEPTSDTINIPPEEQKVLRYDLRARYFITSTPFGADVVLGDSIIGTTPIVAVPSSVHQSLMLRKSGYEPMSIQLPTDRSGVISVPLKKMWQNDGNGDTYFKDSDAKGPGSAGLYISGAATLISGVAAAYFKIKADDKYQQYLNSNDGKILSQTHRLDTAAGIAIAATQLGLGLFTYFIFSQ